jgi:aminopeptidase N
MTDALAALTALANTACAERGVGLTHFYDVWHGDPEVLDKWFEVQAVSRLPGTLAEVMALTRHPDFSYSNPSRLRATIGGFAADNKINFHAADGSAYRFVASQIIVIDAQTAITASGPGLAKVFDEFARWRRFDATRQALMRGELVRMAETPGISAPLRDRLAGILAPA